MKCLRLHGRQRGEFRHSASGHHDSLYGLVVLKGSHLGSMNVPPRTAVGVSMETAGGGTRLLSMFCIELKI